MLQKIGLIRGFTLVVTSNNQKVTNTSSNVSEIVTTAPNDYEETPLTHGRVEKSQNGGLSSTG